MQIEVDSWGAFLVVVEKSKFDTIAKCAKHASCQLLQVIVLKSICPRSRPSRRLVCKKNRQSQRSLRRYINRPAQSDERVRCNTVGETESTRNSPRLKRTMRPLT
jgi:hypothetical protein